jgi:uncharacterized protein
VRYDRGVLAALTVIAAAVLGVADVPNPRDRNGWVSDTAGVLDDAAEARLDAMIEELHDRSTVEIAVVTADRVDDTPKAFATKLFNHWGVGSAAHDNGVLVLLVMSERRLEMETGIGMEKILPGDWLVEMQGRVMVPRFKEGDFSAGLEAGVRAVIEKLATTAEGDTPPAHVAHVPPEPATEEWQPTEPNDPPWWVYGISGGLFFGGAGTALWARRRWWRKMKTCQQCQHTMLLLDELADDEKLDPGQRTEETIRAVDYMVFVCPGCQWSRTVRRALWFSGYGRCASCSYKAVGKSSTTLVQATYDHGGTVQVTESCRHCGQSRTYTRSTPARSRPSSSSSRGGSSFSSSSRSSSFGGGRSRGGGGGSSW